MWLEKEMRADRQGSLDCSGPVAQGEVWNRKSVEQEMKEKKGKEM